MWNAFLVIALCLFLMYPVPAVAAAPKDASGHPLAAYAGFYRGTVRGKAETMDIVLRSSRLYIATHGQWESCWIAKPTGRGMAFVQSGPDGYSGGSAFAVDTFWEVALKSNRLRIYDQELGGPLYVYDFKRVANAPRQNMMWSGAPKRSCLPKH